VSDPVAIAVVIPARDEQARIAACLVSVLLALEQVPLASCVVIVAHRCTDGTARIAERLLGDRGMVLTDESGTVSQARSRGAEAALMHLKGLSSAAASGTWLLSTDADTTVPTDWVTRTLTHAARGAVAVAGLARLDCVDGLTPAARRMYADLVRSGIEGDSHRHAYAANLAVRADAYLEVGGWPHVWAGEEHALLSALEHAGRFVLRTTDVVVSTSSRQEARARGGLGDLLKRLVITARAGPSQQMRPAAIPAADGGG
jgi:glycosyltransferase involved in cell wall biosynthesis